MKLTDSNKFKFINGIIFMGSGSFVRMLFGFLNIIIASRILTKDELGLFFLIFTIVSFISAFSEFGLRPAVIHKLSMNNIYNERSIIISNILIFYFFIILVCILLVIFIKPFILFIFSSHLLSSLFIFLPFFYLVHTLEVLLDSIMLGLHLYEKSSFIKAITGFINSILVIFFLIIYPMGLIGFLMAHIFSLTISFLIRFWVIPFSFHFSLDMKVLKPLVRFGIPLQINDILTYFSQRLDILLLGSLASPTAVGYLSIARRIPENMQRLFESFYSVYFPHLSYIFAQNHKSDAEKLMNKVIRLSSFITLSFALIFFLYQEEIIIMLFSEKYLPCAPALGLLMIIFTFSVLSTILDYTLISAGHPDYIPFISLTDTIPSVIANIFLIPLFGFMGAVYAKFIANIITTPFSLFALLYNNIDVKIIKYLIPFFIFITCLAIYFIFDLTFYFKLFVFLFFILLCFLFSSIKWQDITELFFILKHLLKYTIQPSLNN